MTTVVTYRVVGLCAARGRPLHPLWIERHWTPAARQRRRRIADFPDDRAAHAACRFVDETCFDLGLLPDARPIGWITPAVLARAQAEGVVLS